MSVCASSAGEHDQMLRGGADDQQLAALAAEERRLQDDADRLAGCPSRRHGCSR